MSRSTSVISSSVIMKAALMGVLVLSLITSSLTAQSESPGEDSDVQGAIRLFSAWMDGQMAYRGLPGVVVGVVADQELVWAQGFGFADIDANRPMALNTRFRMASHSKLFTATAIMQLREQGQVHLDDPVSEYLPWFQLPPAEPGDPPITIEHLLTHSSGLPRETRSHWTHLGLSYSRGDHRPHAGAAGGLLSRGPMEVFELGVHPRRNGCRGGERRGVVGLCPSEHLRAPRDERIQRGP